MADIGACAKCGKIMDRHRTGPYCPECLGETSKTRTCRMCGGLIEAAGSRFICARCDAKQKDKADDAGEPLGSDSPVPQDGARPSPPAILVIDDIADMRELIRMRLEKNGYEVFLAADGEEGYRMIKDIRPDLIIADILMPKLTGYDLLQRLKKDTDGAQKIPVIIITSKGSMKEFFSDWEIHSFIVKPIDFEQLLSKIRELLDRARKSGL